MNTYLMKVFKRKNDFPDINAHFVLFEPIPLIQMRKQFSTAHEIWKHKSISINPMYRLDQFISVNTHNGNYYSKLNGG